MPTYRFRPWVWRILLNPWFVLLLYLVVVAYWLAPYVFRAPSGDLSEIFPGGQLVSIQRGESRFKTITRSPLVAVDLEVTRPLNYSAGLEVKATPYLRWDVIVLISGSFATLFFLLRQMSVFGRELWSNSSDSRAKTDDSLGRELRIGASKLASQSATDVLSDDVVRAIFLANSLYARSTFLLVGGIIMSFIGICVFWVSLPTNAESSLAPYLAHAVRPIGMLIFVEAIAWFLLRQYRTLIEDYKSFHRIYLRRVNLLIALKLSSNAESLTSAVLLDDVSGRLKKDETTEGIEGVKLIEPNPVVDLFSIAVRGALQARGHAAPQHGEHRAEGTKSTAV